MTSVAEIDLSEITSPIAGDNPAGLDLRSDETHGKDFREVRDLRNDARRLERMMDDGTAEEGDKKRLSQAWPQVCAKGEEILAQWSKDLEIAAYLIEAYARLDGFAGVARGFRTARELVVNYWEHLYPQPDEDGLATRVLPITWLNGLESEGSLIQPLARIPLTGDSPADDFALWQYKQAESLAGLTDPAKREDRLRQGAATREQIDRACNQRSDGYVFFPKLVADIQECQREFKELDDLLTEKCGPEHAPPSSKITSTLQDCLDAAKDIGKKWLDGPPPGAGENGQGSVSIGGLKTGGGSFQLSTREDAFRILMAAADFFERTEPQSLLPAQIRRVVRWGKLTPQELFTELLEDGGALAQMFKLVGMSSSENTPSE